jgi:hypothetical protein
MSSTGGQKGHPEQTAKPTKAAMPRKSGPRPKSPGASIRSPTSPSWPDLAAGKGAGSKGILYMEAGQPDQEQEENAIGPDGLGLVRPGHGGAEDHAQGRVGHLPGRRCCRPKGQAAQEEEEPAGEADLAGGQKGESDKSRDRCIFSACKSRRTAVLAEIGTGQDQGGYGRHLGKVKA